MTNVLAIIGAWCVLSVGGLLALLVASLVWQAVRPVEKKPEPAPPAPLPLPPSLKLCIHSREAYDSVDGLIVVRCVDCGWVMPVGPIHSSAYCHGRAS